MTTHTFNFRDKQALIRHLASLYIRQCIVLQFHAAEAAMHPYEMNGAHHFVSFIDGVLELLQKEHQDILVNDFFHKKTHDWWYSYYSKTTYYRVKSTAMSEFLRCL